jgi:hypothetical protein
LAGVDALDLEVGRQPERFGKRRRAGIDNVLVGDDVERGRRRAERFFRLRRRFHLDLRQLLDRQIGKILGVDALRGARGRAEREIKDARADS